MRATSGSVGPRGVSLLVVTAVAGIVLAVHGWSVRSQPAPSSFADPSAPATTGTHHPASTPSPAAPSPSPGHSSPTAKAGPLLSAQSYASYSFQVWPGTPSAAAKAAMTGLSVSVHRTGSGLSVRAGVQGQPAPAARTFSSGARVYIVEASMGDEAGNADYNLGDDALIVTDTHGRIVQ